MSQYSSLKNKLINGDCLEELKNLDDNSVDLLCTDPPYGYGFMGKHWDTFQEKKSTKSQTVGWMSPGMNKSTYGMKEFFVPIWKEAFRVLKPGAFSFVMSAPRSDVQTVMVRTLQEVGFDVSFTPIYWTYATGFPKAMNIGKMIDKRKGLKGKVVGKKSAGYQKSISKTRVEQGYRKNLTNATNDIEIRELVSDEAKQLNGSYGGYQPKPAVEVVIVAMKPLSQKGYLDQSLDNQKGITWLDDCRIPFAGMNDKEQFDKDNVAGMMNFDEKYKKGEGKMYEGGWEKPMRTSTKSESSPLGRFAANLLVSDDVLNVESKGQLAPTTGNEPSMNKDMLTHGDYSGHGKAMKPRNDGNSFSRYYSLDAWWNSRLSKLPDEVKNTFPFLVVPKASKSEKNNGVKNNIHPTVKPLNLMSYLVTLGSRKNDVVLDPFMGSGTTPMACVTLSRNYIGIEREDEYFEIAEARVNKLEKPMKQWEQWL